MGYAAQIHQALFTHRCCCFVHGSCSAEREVHWNHLGVRSTYPVNTDGKLNEVEHFCLTDITLFCLCVFSLCFSHQLHSLPSLEFEIRKLVKLWMHQLCMAHWILGVCITNVWHFQTADPKGNKSNTKQNLVLHKNKTKKFCLLNVYSAVVFLPVSHLKCYTSCNVICVCLFSTKYLVNILPLNHI